MIGKNKLLIFTCLLITIETFSSDIDSFVNAASKGNIELLSQFLKNNIDVNSKQRGYITALMETVKNNKLEASKFLLEHGANPNIESGRLGTPLWKAAELGYLNLVDLLLKFDANPNYKGDWNIPVLEAAILGKPATQVYAYRNFKKELSNESKEIVKLLLDHKADPTIIDSNGYKASDLTLDIQVKELLNLYTQKWSCLLFIKKLAAIYYLIKSVDARLSCLRKKEDPNICKEVQGSLFDAASMNSKFMEEVRKSAEYYAVEKDEKERLEFIRYYLQERYLNGFEDFPGYVNLRAQCIKLQDFRIPKGPDAGIIFPNDEEIKRSLLKS